MNSACQSKSPYEGAYRSYRRLVRHLLDQGAPAFVAESLADSTLHTRDEKQLWLQSRYHGVESAFEEATPLWRELRGVREALPAAGMTMIHCLMSTQRLCRCAPAETGKSRGTGPSIGASAARAGRSSLRFFDPSPMDRLQTSRRGGSARLRS